MVDTTRLRFDDKATSIIVEHVGRRPDRVLRLEFDRTSGRGGAYYLVRLHWASRERAKRDGTLVDCAGPGGVRIFVQRRLWRYLEWHTMRIHGLKFGPIRRLIPEAGPFFIDDLRAWEASHTSLGMAGTPAA